MGRFIFANTGDNAVVHNYFTISISYEDVHDFQRSWVLYFWADEWELGVDSLTYWTTLVEKWNL